MVISLSWTDGLNLSLRAQPAPLRSANSENRQQNRVIGALRCRNHARPGALGAFPLRRDSDLPGARRRSGRGKGRAGVRSAKMVAIAERKAMPAWADRPRRGFGTARIFYKGLQI